MTQKQGRITSPLSLLSSRFHIAAPCTHTHSGGTARCLSALWQPDAFYADALRNMVFLAAFLGIMIGLFGYNLFLFISLRDLNYLFLAMLLMAAVIYETSQTSFLEF